MRAASRAKNWAKESAKRSAAVPTRDEGAPRHVLAAHACLAVLTIAAYASVLGNAFLEYDDADYITANPRVLAGITWKGIVWAFQAVRGANWHPLTLLSHMLDCQLFGLNAAGHHATSLLLHLASTLLLFHLFLRMTRQIGPSAFVAAVFALHPLHVESVAWAAERKDVLSTFFWISATLAYVRWVERPSPGPDPGRYAAVVFLYALGLLSKPMLVTLPFALLLLDVWPLGRWTSAAQDRAGLVREKIPLFALSAISCVVTYLVQRGEGATVHGEQHSLGYLLGNALVSCATYLGKSIVPSHLVPFVPFPAQGHPAWKVATSGLLLAAITLFALRELRARPWLAVGWFWYLGTLVPVIGIVQVGEQARADRYTYVPMIGLAVSVAFGAAELARRNSAAGRALLGFGAAAALVWTGLTWRQVGFWKDDRTLFGHAVDVNPENHIAHGILGVIAQREQRYEDAIAEYRTALRLNPGYAQWANNMGMALERTGHLEEARIQFEAALASTPDLADAHHNLGYLYATQGKLDAAIEHFEAALRSDSDLPQVHFNLGLARMYKGQIDAAILHFEQTLDLQPGFPQARERLESARSQRAGR